HTDDSGVARDAPLRMGPVSARTKLVWYSGRANRSVCCGSRRYCLVLHRPLVVRESDAGTQRRDCMVFYQPCNHRSMVPRRRKVQPTVLREAFFVRAKTPGELSEAFAGLNLEDSDIPYHSS